MEYLELALRYIWPAVLGWNLYLFRRIGEVQDIKLALAAYKLEVAKEYTTKADLEKMFESLEKRLDERLTLFVDSLKK